MEKTFGGIRLKFSVLIPVYNTEKYLEECLQSVLNQTYQDFEIVIVDDGSTDKSGLICDRYQEQYINQIKVIHQENQGQLASRCNAIQAAQGEYIIFADADDLLVENALEIVNEQLTAYQNPDMLVYSFYYESDKGSKRKANQLFEEGLVDLPEVKKLFFTGTGMNNVWTKAVKREAALCNSFDFTPYYSLRCAEDKLHSMVMVDGCKTFAYVYEPLYRYRLFDGSVTRNYSIESIEKFNSVDLYDIEKEFLMKWQLPYPEYQQRFDALCAREAFYVFDLFYKNTRGKTSREVLHYDWTYFLSEETLARLQNNTFLNEIEKKLWKWICKKDFFVLFYYLNKKIISKKIKSIIRSKI